MFPLTPANNWTATIIFCGGTNLTSEQWTTDWNIPEYPADASCVTISPDIDLTYYDDDPLANGRSMGQFINLPDGRLFFVNGIKTGTAGYGNTTYAVGQSFGDNPDYQSWYYNSSAPSGSKWAQAATSTVPRLYHSSAVLLPDGSVFVSGSNPNADCECDRYEISLLLLTPAPSQTSTPTHPTISSSTAYRHLPPTSGTLNTASSDSTQTSESLPMTQRRAPEPCADQLRFLQLRPRSTQCDRCPQHYLVRWQLFRRPAFLVRLVRRANEHSQDQSGHHPHRFLHTRDEHGSASR